ncbi:hypothetical protein F5Y17DRAFT_458654 [Xylariaceae sp. FL0594]|nr:hypothetical protein F5Y17DRAFT_458654 [Xylariaceae sp. FL0594]
MAESAERDLNSYENKTGAHKTSPNDEAGVDPTVEKRFPGAKVKVGTGIVDANAAEGVEDRDTRRREKRDDLTTEVRGGQQQPGGDSEQKQQNNNNNNNQRFDYGSEIVPPVSGSRPEDPPSDLRRGEMMEEGKEASRANLASDPFVPHKERFRGAEYAKEDVSHLMSAEGHEPPESVTEASRESARYQ